MVNPEKGRASAAGIGSGTLPKEHDEQADAPGEERAGQEEGGRPSAIRQLSEEGAAAGRRSENFWERTAHESAVFLSCSGKTDARAVRQVP
jgi:hypothetical protein